MANYECGKKKIAGSRGNQCREWPPKGARAAIPISHRDFLCSTICQNHSFWRRFGRGMLGRGMWKRARLEIIPLPNIPLPIPAFPCSIFVLVAALTRCAFGPWRLCVSFDPSPNNPTKSHSVAVSRTILFMIISLALICKSAEQ